jgi:hypothetical protein
LFDWWKLEIPVCLDVKCFCRFLLVSLSRPLLLGEHISRTGDAIDFLRRYSFASFADTVDVVLFFMRLMKSNLLNDDVLLNTIAIHQTRFPLKCIGLSFTPLSPPPILGLTTPAVPDLVGPDAPSSAPGR